MPPDADSRTPLADAVAVWHMDDGGDAVGKNAAVTLHGDVKLGVELAGTERKSSLARGGDGKCAEFNGGYMVAAAARDKPPCAHAWAIKLTSMNPQ